jgi:predicted amidophosphoribosyltransferase
MPTSELTLPTGEKVRLIYGAKHPEKGTAYLNAVRMGLVDKLANLAAEYRGMEKIYALRLAAQIKAETIAFDAVVSPPSSREDATPYREAVLQVGRAQDRTANFSRKNKVKIGHNDTTLAQAIDELIYKPDGTEAGIKSLLIVDESVASGKTVAAVLHHLREAGLPKDCKVIVCAWARFGS